MNFFDEVKKPYNLITTLISIFALILSVYFYVAGNKVKNLSYTITEPSIIFDSKSATSSIHLITSDSNYVDKSVYLVSGTVWNNGDLPILEEDTRKNLELALENCDQILDYRIVKQSDSSVCDFNLIKESNKKISVNWKHFDPDCGFSFLIIYTGDDTPNFKINGSILGIKSFDEINAKDYPMTIDRFLGISTILCIFIGFLLFRHFSKTMDSLNLLNKLADFIIMLVGSVTVLFLLYKMLFPFKTPID